MARRNEGILDLLAQCPWWVSPLVAAASYLGLRFVPPLVGPVTPDDPASSFVAAASMAAPLVALVLLLPAPVAAVRQWRGRSTREQTGGFDLPTRQAPALEDPGADKTCGRCGADMVLHTYTLGEHFGEHFWSCSRFPRCTSVDPFHGVPR
jgi:hypothetical protein